MNSINLMIIFLITYGINSYIMSAFIVGLRELLSCSITLLLIGLIYKNYKRESTPMHLGSLKEHLHLLLITCIVFMCYNIAENAFLHIYIPNSSSRYSFDLMNILHAVIFAPVAEEFLFRGIILNQMLKRKSFILSNILLSSIFAILHFDIEGVFIIFIFSLTIGCIWKYMGIFCCILFHSLNNLIVVITSKLNIEYLKFTNLMNIVIGVVFSILSVLLLYLIKNSNRGKMNNLKRTL